MIKIGDKFLDHTSLGTKEMEVTEIGLASQYTSITFVSAKVIGFIPNETLSPDLVEIGTIYHYDEDFVLGKLIKSVCECGSDKLGHPGHSGWCPKFKS